MAYTTPEPDIELDFNTDRDVVSLFSRARLEQAWTLELLEYQNMPGTFLRSSTSHRVILDDPFSEHNTISCTSST